MTLTFHYRPGKEIPVADTFSCLHLPNMDKEAESEEELAIHTFLKQIPITEKRMEHMRQESLQDEELSILMQVIENRWPENQKDAPSQLPPTETTEMSWSRTMGSFSEGKGLSFPKH